QPIALPVGCERAAHVRTFLPVDAKPLKIFEELVFVACFAALEVGVFNPQDHGALHLAGEEPVVKRCAGIANMQLPGRRGREANAYFRILSHTLMLARRVEPRSRLLGWRA